MKILNFEEGVCGRVTGNYESHWSGLIVVSIIIIVYMYFLSTVMKGKEMTLPA